MEIKTYDVYSGSEMVGFVDAESNLVYDESGSRVIARLVGSTDSPTFQATESWHRLDLNGKPAELYPVPVMRKF